MPDDPKPSPPKPVHKPDDPGGLSLAFALTILAGAVDAVSYVHWHGLFVSFMSGNTTSLGVQAAHVEMDKALLSLVVIGGFVVGVVAGELVAAIAGRRVAEVVLILEAVLLVAGAAALHTGVNELLAAPLLSFTMGMHNAAVHQGGGISVSLTYVTGTLVHVGRSVAKALRGQGPWLAVGPYALLWFGLAFGAALGALAATRSEPLALLLAAVAAVILAGLVALSLIGRRPEALGPE